jgi:hypothetical protein
MEHDVHALNRAWREGAILTASAFQKVAVEVVNVRRSQLGDSQMSKMWNEMTVDQTSRLTMGGLGPSWRRGSTPLLEKVGNRSRAYSSLARYIAELCKLSRRVLPTSVNRFCRPLFFPARGVDTLIDPKLPRVGASLSH